MKKFYLIVLLLIPYIINNQGLEAKPLITKEVVDENFSPESLKKYIVELGIKHPHIVYAQAILETGAFTSTIFKENNNLFGMKYVDTLKAKKLRCYYRPTVAVAEQYKHAKYKDWKDSVKDYFLWQQMFKRTPIQTEQQYYYLLNKKYAVPGKYVYPLKQIIRKDTTDWNYLKTSLKTKDTTQ